MLLEKLFDCAYHNSQHKNDGEGIAITTHLQELGKAGTDQNLTQKPEATFLRTARRFSSEISYASPDEQLMELCTKIGTETNPKKIATLISQLIEVLD